MENWPFYVPGLILVAFSLYALALVLQARLTRQLINYCKGMLRYHHDEKAVEQHLVAHGIKTEHAERIVLAAQQRYLQEQGEVLVTPEQTR